MATVFIIHVEIDKAKVLRRISRTAHGRPGQGRKTKFVDRKKRANKDACRKGQAREE